MKNWSRLILPLGLGLMAALVNASAMRSRLTPVSLVAVSRDVGVGERLTEADLVRVDVSYPADHLRDHFWLWEDRQTLQAQVATPVKLPQGSLVPRGPFQSWGQSAYEIPPGCVLVEIRLDPAGIAPNDRRLLLPGRPVRLQFDDNGLSTPLMLAFINACRNDTGDTWYQAGVILERKRHQADCGRLLSGGVKGLIALGGTELTLTEGVFESF